MLVSILLPLTLSASMSPLPANAMKIWSLTAILPISISADPAEAIFSEPAVMTFTSRSAEPAIAISECSPATPITSPSKELEPDISRLVNAGAFMVTSISSITATASFREILSVDETALYSTFT